MESTSQNELEVKVQAGLHRMMDPVADLLAETYLPPEKRKKESKNILDSLMGIFRQRFQRGFNLCLEYVHDHLSPVEGERIILEWEEGHAAYVKYLEEHPDKHEDEEGEMVQLEDVMKISGETIEHYYQAGIAAYEAKTYEDAVCIFTFLTLLNAFRPNVWLALGMCLKKTEDFETAANAYAMAIMTDSENPLVYLEAAENCLELQNKEGAEKFLKIAEELIKKENREDLNDFVNAIRNKLRR